jgi:4-hydroxybenzoate polyprenyltransferase
MNSSSTYRISWPVALRLGRISNLPTVWTNVLAGLVLSGAPVSFGVGIVLMATLSLFYVAGMYLNDAFDAGFDRQHRPGRPIPSGDAAATMVFIVGAVLLWIGLLLLLALGYARPAGTGLRGFGAGLALGVAIVVYDIWHKGNPIGPLLMGLCRVLVYVTAAASAAGVLPIRLLCAAGVTLSYLIGLTYAAKQEDLMRVRHFWPLLFLAAPFVYGLPVAARGGVGALIYVLLLAAVLYALSFMVWRSRVNISRVVMILIAGISLLDGLFIASQEQAALAALTVVAFVLTLVFQRYIAGT